VVLGVIPLAGCAAFNPNAPGNRTEIAVVFAPNHTAADVARVRAECNGVGGAKAEPHGPNNAMDRSRPLRFNVTGLSPKQQAELSTCLSEDRSVQGYEDNNDGG
jgi:hypothetical protein